MVIARDPLYLELERAGEHFIVRARDKGISEVQEKLWEKARRLSLREMSETGFLTGFFAECDPAPPGGKAR